MMLMFSPATGRSLAMALLVVTTLLGCKDSSPTTPVDDTPDDGSPSAQFYIQARIGDSLITQQEVQGSSTGGFYGQGAGASGEETVGKSGYLLSQDYDIGHYIYIGNEVVVDPAYHPVTIYFIKTFGSRPFGSEIDALIGRGTIAFGSRERERDGVEIRWVDARGTEWSTAYGSAVQTGSSFIVTDHVKNPSPSTTDPNRYESKGTFTAKLYNQNGNMIAITDGKFSLRTVFTN